MPHISFSALKDWNFCAWYHKLTRIDKVTDFVGNEFTAFGNAMHEVCEKKLLKEDIDDEQMFLDKFDHFLSEIPNIELDSPRVSDMREQAKIIIPEIEDALDDYFGEYEVLGAEIPLNEPIENEDTFICSADISEIMKNLDFNTILS